MFGLKWPKKPKLRRTAVDQYRDRMIKIHDRVRALRGYGGPQMSLEEELKLRKVLNQDRHTK